MSETKNPVARMPSQAASKPLRDCESLADAFKSQEFLERIKDSNALVKNMDENRVLQGLIQAANKQPLIYKCDFRQTVGVLLSLVWMGLVPGTIMGHAHLIPFARRRKNEIVGYDMNVIIGYQGYLELATRADAITSVHCDVALKGDRFDYEFGTNKFLHHSYGEDRDYANPRHAYAWVKMREDGDDQFEVMPWADVEKIRERSQAYKTALSSKAYAEEKGWRIPSSWTEAPWVRDPLEMGKKTAFRRLAKWLPKCPTLRVAAAIEDAQEYGHGVDYGPIIDGSSVENGISPREQDPEDDADPGAAFTDRREEPEVPAQTRAPAPEPRTRRRSQKSESPKDTVTPPIGTQAGVELRMIDEFGEQVETTFTSYLSFATMLSSRWHRLEDDPKLRAQLLEHNEGTISAAEQDAHPTVLSLLKQLQEEPPTQADDPPPAETADPPETPVDWDAPTETVAEPETPGPMQYAVLYPITERGKQQWGTWVNEMRDEAATYQPTDLPAWLEVQRPVIDEAPQASLLAVVRHICAAFAKHSLMPPSWLVEKVGAPKSPEPAAPKPQEPTAKERKYANDRLADLEYVELTVDGRYTFERLVALMKSDMKRLRESHPELYDEIRVAYEEKRRKLPELPGGG